MIFSAYRRDDYADPDNFVLQVGMVLERYPDSVIGEACSPLTGIQRTCQFPPSIAELVAFCDDLLRRQSYAQQWDEQSRKQLEERDEFENTDSREPLEHRRRIAKRITAELAERGMRHFTAADVTGPAKRASTAGADGARAGATDRSPPDAPNGEQAEETFQQASPPPTW